ncbi:MAG: SpoVA/SpoVAEb family sporulation membrane protein [Oscillospiraceae bacterium]|nr:SpoVA/SpoVAEb family sporulation membrane protein [Oscillospiraceae bacterium]
MKTDKNQYETMVHKASPDSPHAKNFLLAFLVGGAICAFGQGLYLAYEKLGFAEEQVKIMVPCTLIFLTALATAFGVFDKLGKHAGAGTGVPITGFANAIAAPAMETRCEGLILGVGANLFKLAGPVLAYGSAVSTIYGLIYFFFGRG